jgi:hypothetical protein
MDYLCQLTLFTLGEQTDQCLHYTVDKAGGIMLNTSWE